MRAAIVANGIVTGVIMIDENTDLDLFNAIPCGNDVSIGWLYEGGSFSAPPLPTPGDPQYSMTGNK